VTTLLSALAVALAAFCIWLTVRIVNRRERWAKRLAIVIACLPILYVLSFGPACFICSFREIGKREIPAAYRPIGWLAVREPTIVGRSIVWYGKIWVPRGGLITVPVDGHRFGMMIQN
jgi:hypothetical protein